MGEEMEIPVFKHKGEIVGAVVITVFILFFVVVAVFDIINGIALIQSVLWLLLVGSIITAITIDTGGFGTFVLKLLGCYVARHFAGISKNNNEAQELHTGYRVFGRRVVLENIAVDEITRVNWYAGQVSDQCGKDMDDWTVAVWFKWGKPDLQLKNKDIVDEMLIIVGSSGRKEKTEALGLALVDLLKGVGVPLVEGEKDTEYIRQV